MGNRKNAQKKKKNERQTNSQVRQRQTEKTEMIPERVAWARGKSITGELRPFLLMFDRSYQKATWLPFLPASANQRTESSQSTLHLRHRSQRGGSCCLLPGCSGRGDCHWARRLHRSRADRWTGSRCPPAAGPGSLGGSPGRRGDPKPPGPCTWRTPLEERFTCTFLLFNVGCQH